MDDHHHEGSTAVTMTAKERAPQGNRVWTHLETPDGLPSRAAYNNGCHDGPCRVANALYMKAYRDERQAKAREPDHTGTYHSHKGQPSRRTAVKHKCRHARCLALAGLEIRKSGDAHIIVDPTNPTEALY